jgi:hypothetical protein
MRRVLSSTLAKVFYTVALAVAVVWLISFTVVGKDEGGGGVIHPGDTLPIETTPRP